ncbi:MAG: nucleoside hydrolase-like domain-containing protein, partial [Geminicoccaceae bacterium]
MTSRTVVILTEPERCELADADTLVQAVLQIQQLNKAGLGGSQTFCDHPAAAVRFIEAYAKAYPELQLRSSDLPPPEQLYSIIADGRVMPLQGAAAPDIANTGEAGQLYPLYVLSLGAPDALMQALQHNRFAKSDIQVVEIAPIESSGSEPVSVAEAVAHEPHSGSSWGAEGSAELGHNGELLPLEELSSSGPLKLASVEVNLDHIQVDRGHDQKDPYIPVLDEPATVAVVAPPATGPVGAAGGGPQP